jgi:hypothetical protein
MLAFAVLPAHKPNAGSHTGKQEEEEQRNQQQAPDQKGDVNQLFYAPLDDFIMYETPKR